MRVDTLVITYPANISNPRLYAASFLLGGEISLRFLPQAEIR